MTNAAEQSPSGSGTALRGGAQIAVAVAALMLPWMLWSGAAGRALPGPLQDILGSYSGWFGGQACGGGPAFQPFVPHRQHPDNGRLLEHDLADKDAPGRTRGLAPGQVAGGFAEPAVDTFVQQVKAGQGPVGTYRTLRTGRARGNSGGGGFSVDANTVMDVFGRAETGCDQSVGGTAAWWVNRNGAVL